MNGDNGFTYPAALLMIVVVSSALLVAQQQWSIVVKRDKEKELLFRGRQIYKAIESYYNSSPNNTGLYPKSFNHLLKDNRFPMSKRHLRRVYTDPVTKRKSWGIIYDGKGGIKGVYSTSPDEPMKKAGFEKIFKVFENTKKYSDWKFIYEPKKEGAT